MFINWPSYSFILKIGHNTIENKQFIYNYIYSTTLNTFILNDEKRYHSRNGFFQNI